MEKLNCWQVEKCGREPSGPKSKEFGVCPAATETRLNGTHGGINGGRACWVIAGTLCRGKIQGTYASKVKDCLACEFYHKVKEEESGGFNMAIILLAKLR